MKLVLLKDMSLRCEPPTLCRNMFGPPTTVEALPAFVLLSPAGEQVVEVGRAQAVLLGERCECLFICEHHAHIPRRLHDDAVPCNMHCSCIVHRCNAVQHALFTGTALFMRAKPRSQTEVSTAYVMMMARRRRML